MTEDRKLLDGLAGFALITPEDMISKNHAVQNKRFVENLEIVGQMAESTDNAIVYDFGCSLACSELASIYELGAAGVPKNLQKAAYYKKLGAKLEDKKQQEASNQQSSNNDVQNEQPRKQEVKSAISKNCLDKFDQMDIRDIFEIAMYFSDIRDYEQLYAWVKYCADRGYVTAFYWMGMIYEHGSYVKPNKVRSLEWYRKAAENRYPHADYYVDKLSRSITQDDYRERAEEPAVIRKAPPENYKEIHKKALEETL